MAAYIVLSMLALVMVAMMLMLARMAFMLGSIVAVFAAGGDRQGRSLRCFFYHRNPEKNRTFQFRKYEDDFSDRRSDMRSLFI
jgi:hypothetical protein